MNITLEIPALSLIAEEMVKLRKAVENLAPSYPTTASWRIGSTQPDGATNPIGNH